jgi:hypothetical protein
MATERFFKYIGPACLTRGDFGVNVRGGHSAQDDPEALAIFDPDYGDRVWSSIEAALASGEWVEVTRAEWQALA